MPEILSIVFGSWLTGTIGYCVRKTRLFFLVLFGLENKVPVGRRKPKSIKFDDDQNQITGLKVILILVVVFGILQSI